MKLQSSRKDPSSRNIFYCQITIIKITRFLTRIFHTDRNEEAAKADGARRAMKSDDGCVCVHTARGRLRDQRSIHMASRPPQVIGMKYAG